MCTKLLYQYDATILEHESRVTQVISKDDGASQVILDETIFYPQGGGQPTDTGTITSVPTPSTFKVKSVRMDMQSGTVTHEGTFDGVKHFAVGDKVQLQVDQERRTFHSRLHAAGHVIDYAVERVGLHLKVEKGYHFPDSPYVCYSLLANDTTTQIEKIPSLREQIELAANAIVQEDCLIQPLFLKPSEIDAETFAQLPEKAQASAVIRLVKYEGLGKPNPCGGTHVPSTKMIGPIKVSKITTKGGLIKVSYNLA